jgi:hypothetical protein
MQSALANAESSVAVYPEDDIRTLPKIAELILCAPDFVFVAPASGLIIDENRRLALSSPRTGLAKSIVLWLSGTGRQDVSAGQVTVHANQAARNLMETNDINTCTDSDNFSSEEGRGLWQRTRERDSRAAKGFMNVQN